MPSEILINANAEQQSNRLYLKKHGISLENISGMSFESPNTPVGGVISFDPDTFSSDEVSAQTQEELGDFLANKYTNFINDKYGTKLTTNRAGNIQGSGAGRPMPYWQIYNGSFFEGAVSGTDERGGIEIKLASPNPSSEAFKGSGARQIRELSEFVESVFGISVEIFGN